MSVSFLNGVDSPLSNRASQALADLGEFAGTYAISDAEWTEETVRHLETARARLAAALFPAPAEADTVLEEPVLA
ncbi:hypothetical protein [Limnoglobus roseus]|uniref:Uncharacterized protein n=1 Tax=Limnoglobus roseus TaxID=2598579 RepID=A0A5C1AII0_9BACT|nr:hypothetical protein [Limnoglobus roseus]QEL16934.1 hypothetical protein PX52LOC_03910 [Limnoglobus roseus]